MFDFFRSLFKLQKEYPRILSEVNNKVNKQIWYTSDQNNYGKSDVWVIYPANGKGDCEDYALTKQQELIKKGIPEEDIPLNFVFYKPKSGSITAHAVLVYKNTWVLDNRTDTIRKKNDLTEYFGWLKWNQNLNKRNVYNGRPPSKA